MSALKTCIISGMSAPHSSNSNCEKDDKGLLTNFHDVLFEDDKENVCFTIPEEDNMYVDTDTEHPVTTHTGRPC